LEPVEEFSEPPSEKIGQQAPTAPVVPQEEHVVHPELYPPIASTSAVPGGSFADKMREQMNKIKRI
jgi:hypothetical protein